MNIIIFFLILFFCALVFSIIKQSYKIAYFTIASFVIFSVITIIYFFTSIPYDIGIKRTPKIEFIKIRRATEFESNYYLYDINTPSYIVECLSDMRLEEWQNGPYRLYCSQIKSNFSYENIIQESDETLMEFNEITFIEEKNGKYIYNTPFQLITCTPNLAERKIITHTDVKQDLHCAIFYVWMLKPVVSTSEMIIPLDSLKIVINK